MALSKTLLLLCVTFLVVSSIISAREVAETGQESSQVDLDNYEDGRGGYNRGHGKGYGKGGKGHGKGKGHGGKHRPPLGSTEEGN